MPEPESPIRVAISDHFQMDGISVLIGIKMDGQTVRVFHFDENGNPRTELSDLMAEVKPAFRLPHDIARALLDALIRYYQGSGDFHLLRADYLHERERTDKLIDAVIESNAIQVRLSHSWRTAGE